MWIFQFAEIETYGLNIKVNYVYSLAQKVPFKYTAAGFCHLITLIKLIYLPHIEKWCIFERHEREDIF